MLFTRRNLENFSVKGNNILKIIVTVSIYQLLGTYDYFTHRSISTYIESISEGLDDTIMRPAKIFGIMLRFMGSHIYDSDLFFIFGQLVGLISYSSFLWLILLGLTHFLEQEND